VYGVCAGEMYYNYEADLNNNGCVGLSDLAELLAYFGQSH